MRSAIAGAAIRSVSRPCTVQVEGHADIEVRSGDTLLEACDAHHLPMESACGGFAVCNSCRVRVLDGEGNLSPRLDEELAFLDDEGQRLGCQARVLGDVRVRLEPG
jgi:ferredoxin